MFRKLIGTRAFYRHVLLLAVPIMIQNGITNFVNMLDNVMVGSLGTHEMTGVAVSNQLMFVSSVPYRARASSALSSSARGTCAACGTPSASS